MWPVKRIKLARIWFSSSSELDIHPLGVNKSLKYYFNHPEMLTPSTNVSFKTTPWGSHRLKMPRDKLSLQRMSRWNPVPFLQYSAIFVVFVFICMFRSKGSVVKIYINIYPVQSNFHFFFLENIWIYRKKEKLQCFVGKSQLTSQREQLQNVLSSTVTISSEHHSLYKDICFP